MEFCVKFDEPISGWLPWGYYVTSEGFLVWMEAQVWLMGSGAIDYKVRARIVQ